MGTKVEPGLSTTPKFKLRDLSKWMNAIADAHANKIISWAYPSGVSLAVITWKEAYELNGEEAALQAIIALATNGGVSLRKHK